VQGEYRRFAVGRQKPHPRKAGVSYVNSGGVDARRSLPLEGLPTATRLRSCGPCSIFLDGRDCVKRECLWTLLEARCWMPEVG
jgi:hypothetical protein